MKLPTVCTACENEILSCVSQGQAGAAWCCHGANTIDAGIFVIVRQRDGDLANVVTQWPVGEGAAHARMTEIRTKAEINVLQILDDKNPPTNH